MQKYNISFKGQKIFIGIDVHKKNWDVAIALEIGIIKRHCLHHQKVTMHKQKQ